MIKLKFPSVAQLALSFLFVAVVCPKVAMADPNGQVLICGEALNSKSLSTILEENRYGDTTEQKTVNYQGHNSEGQVVLLKSDKKSVWDSKYAAFKGSAHGDPRLFFYFAGTELAQNLGFDMRESEEGIYLLAPSAKLLKSKIEKLNQYLIQQGEEPITGLPVKAGYVHAEEMLRLSVDTEAPYALYFPYEDSNAELTVHEISYHLFMLLYSKKILTKVRQINLATLKLAADLRQAGLAKAEVVIKALLDDRTEDYDAGIALLGYWLAKAQSAYPGHTYSYMLSKGFLYPGSMQQAITILADPSRSAEEHVISEKLKSVLDSTTLLDSREKQAFLKWRETKMKSEAYVSSLPKARSQPSQWLIEFVTSLDGRIEVLNKAFQAIKD